MLISELLPNPQGKDSDGEFIEIRNEKKEPASLLGWTLKDKSGKVSSLSGVIPGDGYRVFTAKQTKLALNQSDEAVLLIDPTGSVIDRVAYVAAAPEGSSYARKGGYFFFTPTPTPGEMNQFPRVTASAFHEAPYGVIGTSGASSLGAAFLGILIAACLSAAALWAIRQLNGVPAANMYDKPLTY